MTQNVDYVGVDVDDARYHGCALDKGTGEVLDLHCRPTLKGLVQQLKKVQEYFGGLQLQLCYEASYVGFLLQRDLMGRGFRCDVVAPSSIPRRAGKAVKTDRVDAMELAGFYVNDLLTIVVAPDAQTEQDRDFLCSRQQSMQQQGKMNQHAFRPADPFAELAHQCRPGSLHFVNRDPVVMGVGHVGAALFVEVHVMRTRLVVRAEFGDELQGPGIENRDPVVPDVGHKQILPIR